MPCLQPYHVNCNKKIIVSQCPKHRSHFFPNSDITKSAAFRSQINGFTLQCNTCNPQKPKTDDQNLLTPANRSKDQQYNVFHYPNIQVAKQLIAIYQSTAMSCLVNCGRFFGLYQNLFATSV